MSKRFSALFVSCIVLCLVPRMSHGQETDDTRAIRAMLTTDQEAWHVGDGKQILSQMDEHFVSFRAPTINGELDLTEIKVQGSVAEGRKMLLSPEFKGAPGKEAMADTLLDFQSSHEFSRIDVKGDYAVAVSRIRWSQNDTTAAKPTREGGGWESVWFLRKDDGTWKFTGALGFTKTWED
jgi:hypothetical protein